MPPINISTRLAETPVDGAFLRYSERKLSGKTLLETVAFSGSESRGSNYSQLVPIKIVPTPFSPTDFTSYFQSGTVVLGVDATSVYELDADGAELSTIVTLEDIRDVQLGYTGGAAVPVLIISNRDGSTDQVVVIRLNGSGSFGSPVEINLPNSNSGITSAIVAPYSNNDIWYTAETTSKIGQIFDALGTPVIFEYDTATAAAEPMGLVGSNGLLGPNGAYGFFLQASAPSGRRLGRIHFSSQTIDDYGNSAIDAGGPGALVSHPNDQDGIDHYISYLYGATDDDYLYRLESPGGTPAYDEYAIVSNGPFTGVRRGLDIFRDRLYACVGPSLQACDLDMGGISTEFEDAGGDFETLAFVDNNGVTELWATGSGRSDITVLAVSSKELPIISGNRTDGSQLFWQQVPDEEFGVLVGNDDLPATGKRVGKVTLSSGAATVETTAFTATCGVRLTGQGGGTIANAGVLSVDTANSTPGTSFDIVSSNNSDDNEVLWEIIEP